MIFAAASLTSPQPDQSLLRSIAAELVSGVDASQISRNQIGQIPFDYIRQVCALEPAEVDEGEEVDDEKIVEQNK